MSPNIKSENIIDPNDKSLLLEMPKEATSTPATHMSKFDKTKENFHVMGHMEPHAIRRVKILEAHPEVEKLLQKDPNSLYWAIALNIVQLVICYLFKHYITSWYWTVFWGYMVGAIINHGLFVLMHDITHFTCFKSVTKNHWAAILANLPQVLPSAISFGRYHRDHHTYLGDEMDDPDIPTQAEIRIFNNLFSKLFFMMTMPVYYAFRPYLKKPKVTNLMEATNIICCIVYDCLIYKYFGSQALVYLLLGTWFGLSIHPVGIHILSEHYEFNKGQDTYSYYGWINYINFNIGYHIEHHDFPNISWNKLPLLTKMAPEFYENMPVIDSYLTVMYKYVFDSEIGPWSRITREPENKNKTN